MLDAVWKSEARVEIDDLRVEVGEFEWPSPVETQACEPLHQFSLSLTPRPAHSQVRYDLGGAARRFANVGDLIFFPRDVPFWGRSDGGRQRIMTCSFGGERLAALGRGSLAWSESELDRGLNLNDTKMRANLARMAQEAIGPGFAGTAMIEALATVVLIDLTRHLKRSPALEESRSVGLAGWQMRRIRDRVQSADEPSPSIGDLASLCGVSPRHLMRGFKQASGTTLYAYIEAVRLDRAKALLLETRLPLKTISWRLGFAHPSSFSVAFMRALGVTPTEFRAQCGRRVA